VANTTTADYVKPLATAYSQWLLVLIIQSKTLKITANQSTVTFKLHLNRSC